MASSPSFIDLVTPRHTDETLSSVVTSTDSDDGFDIDDDDDVTSTSSDAALVSTETLGVKDSPGADAGRESGQSESALTHEEKVTIMRRLLREVTLETTLAKFRGMPEGSSQRLRSRRGDRADRVSSHRFLPAMMDHSYNLAIGGKDRLLCVDREYMIKLELQLEQQYQSLMDKKEEERADLERQRMRRLMVEGIIGQEALQEEGYLNTRGRTSISPSWKGAPHSNKKTGTTPASSRGHAQAASARAPSNRKGTSPCKQTPRYSESSFNGETQISLLNTSEEQNDGQERRAHFRKCLLHDEEGCTCDFSQPERHAPVTKPYQDPVIEQLKEPEVSVEAMYQLADTILPADRPKLYLEQDNLKGKKKLTAAQERRRREQLLSGVPRR